MLITLTHLGLNTVKQKFYTVKQSISLVVILLKTKEAMSSKRIISNNVMQKHLPLELDSIKNYLKITESSNLASNRCEIINSKGKGFIDFLKLGNGFKALDFNCRFLDDTILQFNDSDKDNLYFMYGLEGSCLHKFEHLNSYKNIDAFKTAILGSSSKGQNMIVIEKNTDFVFSLIRIERKLFFKQFLEKNEKSKLTDLNKSFEPLNNSIYISKGHLKIAKEMRSLESLKGSNQFHDMLHKKSHYDNILALHLEVFSNELNENVTECSLSASELKKINELTDFIGKSFEQPHSVKDLCYHVGMSPAKLQYGFRMMHNTTVADYIRNLRVERAEFLLMNSDYNISEIVYMIGLTSRSYFSKIFKAKYNYSPTHYRTKHAKSIVV